VGVGEHGENRLTIHCPLPKDWGTKDGLNYWHSTNILALPQMRITGVTGSNCTTGLSKEQQAMGFHVYAIKDPTTPLNSYGQRVALPMAKGRDGQWITKEFMALLCLHSTRTDGKANGQKKVSAKDKALKTQQMLLTTQCRIGHVEFVSCGPPISLDQLAATKDNRSERRSLDKKFKDVTDMICDLKFEGHWRVRGPQQVVHYRGPSQTPKMRSALSRSEVAKRRGKGIHIKEVSGVDTNAAGYDEGQCVRRHPANVRDVGLAYTTVPELRFSAMFPPTDYPCKSFYDALDGYYGPSPSDGSQPCTSIGKLFATKRQFLQQWTEYRLCFGPPVSFLEAVIVDSHEVCALEHVLDIMHNWRFGQGRLKNLGYLHDFVQCLEDMPTGIGCRRYLLRLLHRMGAYADSRCCNWQKVHQVHARCCGVYLESTSRHTSWCAFFYDKEVTVEQLEEVTEYRRKMRPLVIDAKILQENAEITYKQRLDYSDALRHEQQMVSAWREDRSFEMQTYWPPRTPLMQGSRSPSSVHGTTGPKPTSNPNRVWDHLIHPSRRARTAEIQAAQPAASSNQPTSTSREYDSTGAKRRRLADDSLRGTTRLPRFERYFWQYNAGRYNDGHTRWTSSAALWSRADYGMNPAADTEETHEREGTQREKEFDDHLVDIQEEAFRINDVTSRKYYTLAIKWIFSKLRSAAELSMSEEENEEEFVNRWDDEHFQNDADAYLRSLANMDGKLLATDYNIEDLQNIGKILMAVIYDGAGQYNRTEPLSAQFSALLEDPQNAPPPPPWRSDNIFHLTVEKRNRICGGSQAGYDDREERRRQSRHYEPTIWQSCKRKYCLRSPHNGQRGEYCCRTCEGCFEKSAEKHNDFLDHRYATDNDDEWHGKSCRKKWNVSDFKKQRNADYTV